MAKGHFRILLLACAVVGLAGCAPGRSEFDAGKRAEMLQDYDTALIHYNRALNADPLNTEYKLKAMRLRFEAGQSHVEQGQKLRERGDLQMALAEFQTGMMIDPTSPIAQQEMQNTLEAIAAQNAARRVPAPRPTEEEPKVIAGPPELQPLSRAPINLKMTNDAKVVFDTVARLAGLTVIFDPDFTSRRISTELTNVTLEQALDLLALEGKAFWKPVTSNVIFVAPDQAQKRRDYEEEIIRTIYLKNTILPQDLTEIVNGLRQLLDLRRVQQFNAQNAIIIRDTPDKVLLAEKIINDVDKPKAEVVVQFAVLQVRRDRLRDLGISPGTSAILSFAPRPSISTPSNDGGNSIPLDQFRRLSSADYSLTLPGATISALLTDSQTRIIDDPQIRIVDGHNAKLRIGDRVPIATGSFQAGIGVGATGTGGSIVNPLVNTQFQYLDVGVIVDVTPRVHPNHDVSLKLSIEVSSVTGIQNIGGINQPVISTRRIEHDVRLRDGEVSILGGLIQRSQSEITTGWPGLSQVPFLRYFTSSTTVNDLEQEVLIVVTPRVIRLPGITAENLRSIASGTDTNPAVRLESQVLMSSAPISSATAPPAAVPPDRAPALAPAPRTQAQLRFEPAAIALRPGETTIVGVVVQDAQDLFSIPILVQYDQAIVSVEDVRQGGFLSGGTQPIAIVQRVDKERGQAIISATRMPNTPGISGSGTLFGIVVQGVAPGTSNLSIVQVNARDSQQRPIPFITSEATVQVQP